MSKFIECKNVINDMDTLISVHKVVAIAKGLDGKADIALRTCGYGRPVFLYESMKPFPEVKKLLEIR